MLQKLTKVVTADNTGLGWLQTIHLYRGSWRRYAYIGEYIKMSVKTILRFPRRIRGKRYRPTRVGFVVRGLVIHAIKNKQFFDSSRLRVFASSVIILKKRGTFRSKYYHGPLTRSLRRYHYYNLFWYYI